MSRTVQKLDLQAKGIKNLMDKYELSSLLYEKSTSNYQEAETRSEFIDPLLKFLDWDVENESGVIFYDREVLREESQQASGSAKKPDYTLRIGGKTKFFVEAKKPSIDITQNKPAIFQARSYGYTAGHPIVILTNFRHLSVYECMSIPNESDPPDASLLFQCSYREYLTKLESVRKYLARDSVASEDWYEQFDGYERYAELPVSKTLFERIADWKLLIAKDVVANYESMEESLIDVIAQKLINRLLFMRVCEDRGIEGENFLVKATKNPTFDVQSFFSQLDARYNSGLFDQSNAISEPSIHVSSSVIKHIISKLYQPYSPFSFSILGADLLGIAYELALTERVKVEIKAGQREVSLVRKKEFYRRDVVTTPQALVELTVADALSNLTKIDISKFKVLDFAIGSGRFLIATYRELVKKLLSESLSNGDFSKLERVGKDRFKLSYKIKCELITNCLYGIDIDYVATEIAKFSLLVTLLEDESQLSLNRIRPILPNLDRNIFHGNTLVRPHSSMSKAEVAESLPLDFVSSGLPTSFDLIVGNPPYMKTEDIKNFSPYEYEYLKRNYAFTFKQFDKYMPFIEFSSKHLKQGGICAAIVPNKWLTNVSGRAMRDYFESSGSIVSIRNFRHVKLFVDKDAYVALLIFTNGSAKSFNYSEPAVLPDLLGGSTTSGSISFLDVHKYNKGCWVLPKDTFEKDVLDKIVAKSVSLKNVVSPRNGIQTSLNQVYVISKSEIVSVANNVVTFTKQGKTFLIESSILRPFLQDSTTVQSHSIVKSDSFIIYPYNLSISQKGTPQYSIIDLKTLRSSYPLAFSYFSYMQSTLSSRSMAISPGQPFYSFGRSQNIASAPQAPKIFYSTNQLGDKYSLDITGVVFESGGTAGEVVLYPNDSGYSLDFVLALLDQAPIEFYIRKSGSPFQGGYYSRGTAVIGEVPVPAVNFDNATEKNWHDDISRKQAECRQINEFLPNLHPNQVTQSRQKFNQLRLEIRDLFLGFWKLTSNDLSSLI